MKPRARREKSALTHDELVQRARKWLRNTKRCGVVLCERGSAKHETPDAIGWKGQTSHLIECKVSRSDFKADAKKIFRRYPELGMGSHRYYMVPKGLVEWFEVPAWWGLLEVESKRVLVSKKPRRFPEKNERAEFQLVLSEVRLFQIAEDFSLGMESLKGRRGDEVRNQIRKLREHEAQIKEFFRFAHDSEEEDEPEDEERDDED